MNRSTSRRRFVVGTTASLLGGGAALSTWTPALQAREKSDRSHGPIRVTHIEVHSITVPYLDWIADVLNHYYGPTKRTIYVAHTDNGLVGLGEGHSREKDEVLQKYVGSSPWDWIGDETSLGLGTAMYDLMGQAAGVPVYKLFGQRYRRWVPVGCWTVSADPQQMVEAVKQYSRMGYTWMKYHLSPFENVLDQLEAMQRVAPEGFKILFDVTMGGSNDHTFQLLDEISKFPIAGAFEDPLDKDIDGYIELRKRCRLPIVIHHAPLGHSFEVLRRAADAYIVGHARIGDAIQKAGLFAAANVPFMLQNAGGDITRSMTTHMQCAFKTASFPFHSDAETWKADVVRERSTPVNGFLRVSEKPGLGVTLDRAELERLKALKLPEQPKWIIKTRFENGTTMYAVADPKNSIFLVRPDRERLVPMSYQSPLTTEWWDDDGSVAYRNMFDRIVREGIVIEE